MTLLMPNGMKVLAPYLAYFDAPLVVKGGGLDHLVAVWQGWKFRLTIQPLLTWVRMGQHFFPYGVRFEWSGYCLIFFMLPVFLSFGCENSFCWCLFFLT